MDLKDYKDRPSPALFFGVIFDLLLFGIQTAQVFIYYISFPNDRVLLKLAVVYVYIAGVAQTGLALLDFYGLAMKKLVRIVADSRNGDKHFVPADHLWLSVTTSTAAVAIVIQSLYAHRIYLISKKRWLVAMILCMSLAQFASGILGAICYKRAESLSSEIYVFLEPRPPSVMYYISMIFKWTWIPVNIFCDLTITICMVTFLVRHRKRGMTRQFRSHITKIIQIVIETGMATSEVSAILMTGYAFLFWGWAGISGWYFLKVAWYPWPGLMMSKVYSNSMLVLLNNRASIVKGRNAVESFEFVEVSGRITMDDSHIQLRSRGRNSTEA